MEDAVFGNNAAIACHMANESYFRQKPVTWDSVANDQIVSIAGVPASAVT
jgi:hypothetical protein